ncbi:hypothetical protein ACINK0_11470 [Deinococcus sp. VB343]|uniref:hypothetical protein n=1 Tax=Deinococcus sp. VB343 TaxID=3385567 RepID=UPI0039C96544
MGATGRMTKVELAEMYQDLTGEAPPKGATRDRLVELVREAQGKAPPKKAARAKVQTRTRSGSARNTVSRSGGGSGGSARSVALAKSAPTVRMRVDSYDQQPARQPGSADILAVALVVFMCVLAAMNTPAKGKGGPSGHAPTPAIVAHA